MGGAVEAGPVTASFLSVLVCAPSALTSALSLLSLWCDAGRACSCRAPPARGQEGRGATRTECAGPIVAWRGSLGQTTSVFGPSG